MYAADKEDDNNWRAKRAQCFFMSFEIRGLYICVYMRRNIEITVNFEHANAHAQNNICK